MTPEEKQDALAAALQLCGWPEAARDAAAIRDALTAAGWTLAPVDHDCHQDIAFAAGRAVAGAIPCNHVDEWCVDCMPSPAQPAPDPLREVAIEHGLCSCDVFGGPRPLGNGRDYHYVGCDYDPALRAALEAKR